jgi:hypothetical protein
MSQLLGAPVKRVVYRPLTKVLRHVEDIGGLIYGGYARYLVTPNRSNLRRFNDIDIFPQHERYLRNITDYLDRHIGNGRVHNYNGVRVYTYKFSKNFFWHDDVPLKIQVVEKFGSPEQIMDGFDITLCQVMVSLKLRQAYFTRDFWNDLIDNRFRFRYPISTDDLNHSSYRIVKYINKGFELDMPAFTDIYRNLADEHDKDYFISCLKQGVLPEFDSLDWAKIRVIETLATS